MKNLKNVSIEEIEAPRKRNSLNYTTTNNTHKRYYKESFVYCDFCGWNRGCNNRDKSYYGYSYHNSPEKSKLRYPSWKLASNAKKQWDRGELNIVEQDTFEHDYGYIDHRLRYIYISILIKNDR